MLFIKSKSSIFKQNLTGSRKDYNLWK